MNVQSLVASAAYWILIALWAIILVFYLGRFRVRQAYGRLFATFIVIMAVDAFRTLFESLFFGAWYTSLAGLLPSEVHAFLVRPGVAIVPKLLNIIAAVLILGILLRRWLPAEVHEREQRKNQVHELASTIEERKRAEEELRQHRDRLEELVRERTAELRTANEQLEQEIIERKQIELELRKSEQRSEAILNALPDMMFQIARDGAFVGSRPDNGDTLTLVPEGLLGQNAAQVLPPETFEALMTHIERALRTGHLQLFECQLPSPIPDGPLRDFEARLVPLGEDKVLVIVRDIAERKQAEEQVRRQAALLAAINEVFQQSLTCETEEDVARTCLNVAETLTGSRFGFIGELNQVGLLDTTAISNPGWEACTMSHSDAVRALNNMAIRGIYGVTLREGASQIVNDPPSHPDSVGVPEGHPLLTCFLGVPLKQAGRTVGMIGLANKESGYDPDDEHATEALAVAFVEALHRKRAEKALAQRATQLALINDIGRQIASELELDSVLGRATRLVQESFGYHHVAIFTIDRKRGELVMRARAGAYSDLYPPEHRLSLGQGMVGWAASHGEMLLANDVRAEPLYVNLYPDRVPTLSELSVPLRMGKEILGVLDVQSPQLDAFDANDVTVMETLADQVTVAIRNSGLYEQARQQLGDMSFLNSVVRTMVASLDLEVVLETTMDRVVDVLQTERGSVLLLDSETGELVFEAVYGRDAEVLKGYRLPSRKGIAGWVARHGTSAIVSDVQRDDRFYPEIDATMGFATRSVLCVPLVSRGLVIGVMQVLNKIGGEFTEDDRRLLEALSATAGSAIENARLYEALEQERGSLTQRVRERTAELSAANADLARAARLKDEFLAAMSHELRTPLNAILGMAEVLEGGIYGQVNEQQLKAVQTIASSGDHLLTLINDILDVAKIGAGTLELEIHTVSVEGVCQASLQFIRQAAAKKCLKVSSSFDSAVTTLQADERRLKQILVNLLSNSVKFTPKDGQIGLEVEGDAAKQVVHFTVWDTGIGISPEDRERLFQPFVQLDGSLSRRHQGTGLGLSLAYQLTDMHGGSISLESQVGRGSRFTVSLPWREPGEEEAEERETRETPQRPIRSLSRPSATVLLAEDNQSSIDTVFDYLLAHGYDVIVARNGVEAVDATRREHPDVILMDIQMPEMDGLEATRQIRTDTTSGVATVPIIALTALAMPGDRERCLEAGADEYLSKPVSLRRLLDAIEGQLSVVAKA